MKEVDPRPPSVFSMTQDEREKFEQQQVDKFCKEHRIPYLKLNRVFRDAHVWINNKTQTLFCYVPKVGCTMLKALYFLALGIVTRNMVTATRQTAATVHHMFSRVTLQLLNDSERLDVVSTYYKFVMLRHPLERLVSAYRDKIEGVSLQGVGIIGWVGTIQHGMYEYVDPKNG